MAVPCVLGPGSDRAVQRSGGTLQTGRLPAAKEDRYTHPDPPPTHHSDPSQPQHSDPVSVCFR